MTVGTGRKANQNNCWQESMATVGMGHTADQYDVGRRYGSKSKRSP